MQWPHTRKQDLRSESSCNQQFKRVKLRWNSSRNFQRQHRYRSSRNLEFSSRLKDRHPEVGDIQSIQRVWPCRVGYRSVTTRPRSDTSSYTSGNSNNRCYKTIKTKFLTFIASVSLVQLHSTVNLNELNNSQAELLPQRQEPDLIKLEWPAFDRYEAIFRKWW
jgi:hypothetical protein